MAKKSGFKGWTNFSTWCCWLWLTNDPHTISGWDARARALKGCTPAIPDINYETQLASELKTTFLENMPELDPGFYAEVLAAGIEDVNWREIATYLLEHHAEA